MHDDKELWKKYHAALAAGDEDTAKKTRAEIVELHLGFFRQYAQRTAFPSWTQDQKDEYYHELVLVAASKVDTYDPERGAKFITHVKPYLQPVRWKIEASRQAIPTGYETARLRALVRRRQSEAMGRGEELTHEELAAELSQVHGKKIGVKRVARIVESPVIVSGDQTLPTGTDKAVTIFDRVSSQDDVADVVQASLESEQAIDAVRSALADLNPSPAEVQIIERVFMAAPRVVDGSEVLSPGPASDADLARDLGIPEASVAELREVLADRLRWLLG